MGSFARGFGKTFQGDSVSRGVEKGFEKRLKDKLRKEERQQELEDREDERSYQKQDRIEQREEELESAARLERSKILAGGDVIDEQTERFLSSGGTAEEARNLKLKRQAKKALADKKALASGASPEKLNELNYITNAIESGQANTLVDAERMFLDQQQADILRNLQSAEAQRIDSEAKTPEQESLERMDKLGGSGDKHLFKRAWESFSNPVSAFKNALDVMKGRMGDVTSTDKKLIGEVEDWITRGINIADKFKEDDGKIDRQELKSYLAATGDSEKEALKALGVSKRDIIK